MRDEDFFLQATNEVDEGKQHSALWAKAVALVEGDEVKAKYQYIKLRVEQLVEADLTNSRQPDYTNDQNSKHSQHEGRKQNKANVRSDESDARIGFIWWKIWAWLGLIIGNLYAAITLLQETPGFAILLIGVNTILMIMVLNFNKYAFLVATILSLNPLLWIVNGIYLKNRWDHPKVNFSVYQCPARNNQVDRCKNIATEKDEQLFEATRAGDLSRIQTLIASGANPHAKDASGYTAEDYARGHGFSEIETFLRNA